MTEREKARTVVIDAIKVELAKADPAFAGSGSLA